MDLALKRKLEIEIDGMLLNKQDEVKPYAILAQQALKKGAYEKAQEHLETARELYVKPMPLNEAVVAGGGAKTKAEANRLINRGAVHVDGIPLRKVNIDVSKAKSVLANGVDCTPK